MPGPTAAQPACEALICRHLYAFGNADSYRTLMRISPNCAKKATPNFPPLLSLSVSYINEAGTGAWTLRRSRMAWVSSPCSAGHLGLRVSALRAPRHRNPGQRQKKLRSTPGTCSSRRLHCAGKSGAHSATPLTRLLPFATNLRSGWSPNSMCVHPVGTWEDALI